MSNVHVAVRVRPFSRREIDQQMIDEREGGLESVLHVRNNRITTRSSAHKDGEPKVNERFMIIQNRSSCSCDVHGVSIRIFSQPSMYSYVYRLRLVVPPLPRWQECTFQTCPYFSYFFRAFLVYLFFGENPLPLALFLFLPNLCRYTHLMMPSQAIKYLRYVTTIFYTKEKKAEHFDGQIASFF